MTRSRVKAQATTAAPPPHDQISSELVLKWWLAALLPLGLGFLMHFVESDGHKNSRLINPVSAQAAFVQAECATFRKGGVHMVVSYAFSAPATAPIPGEPAAAHTPFTASAQIRYPSWAECEADLPGVRAAKAPHPVWYQPDNPHGAKVSLQPHDEPDSLQYLWLGLAGIPIAAYAWLLGALRRRQQNGVERSSHEPTNPAANPAPRDLLNWPLRFVKFTQQSNVKNYLGLLIIALMFAALVALPVARERAGEERVRARSG